MQNNQSNGLGIGSLVAGILSIILAFVTLVPLVGFYPGIFAIILGIVGVVLGAIGGKKASAAGGKSGVATGGLIVSIIALALSVIFFLSCQACVACAANQAAGEMNALMNELEALM